MWGGHCRSTPSISFPLLTLSEASFAFPPLINNQVVYTLLQRLRLKSHFHYYVTYAFEAGAFYLESKVAFLWHPSLSSQAVVWCARHVKPGVFNFK